MGAESTNILEQTTVATVNDISTSNDNVEVITEPQYNISTESKQAFTASTNEEITAETNDGANVFTIVSDVTSKYSTTDEPLFTINQEITSESYTTTTEEQSGFIEIIDPFSNEENVIKSSTTTDLPVESSSESVKTRREKLSDQIRAVISHYKKYGTVTVPDASVPDPMAIPNMKKSFSGMDMTFTNMKVYGLSNFTVEHINTDMDKMQVYVAIYMKQMVILGNYSANVWFRKVAGPFNVTLLYVEASGAAALVRDPDGNLQASESEMDMTFMDSKVKFGNMGIMGSLLQGVAASAGPVLFDAVKPVILLEINNKVRDDINNKIKTIGTKFVETGTTPPLELAMEEGRRYVRENGYDPYKVDNYVLNYMPTNQTMFKINISQLTLTGLSNFRRVGDVSLSMDSGTVQMGLHLATSKLRGRCQWTIAIGKTFQRVGYTNFTVDYIQGRGIINQSLDVSQHPKLVDLDINVGKVRIQSKGNGPFDIFIEAVVNTLPALIRHIIVDAIELPLKFALQHILSEVNVEEVLEKQLPELDKIGL